MEPEQLVSTIDFRYITDVVTKKEAIEMLKKARTGKEEREKYLLENGYPAYTTQVGKHVSVDWDSLIEQFQQQVGWDTLMKL